MTIRSVPEGFEITDYFKKDFLIALGIAEAADESLGYSGGGSPGGMGHWGWTEEYFSDVADPKDRTVHRTGENKADHWEAMFEFAIPMTVGDIDYIEFPGSQKIYISTEQS